MPDIFNDNESAFPAKSMREPDVHGQAAYLLTESLIHGLVANKTLTVDQAIEIVEVATEVKIEISGDLGDSPATMQQSLTLLTGLSESLRTDLA